MDMTKNCVKCLKRPAKVWTGYVKSGGDDILAGWCSYCFKGFSGHFMRRMGRLEDKLASRGGSTMPPFTPEVDTMQSEGPYRLVGGK